MFGSRNGTMLSHALASLAIPARPLSVHQAPTLTVLVTPIGLALRPPPSRARTSSGAITLTAVAGSTEIHRYATASAEKTADCLFGRRTVRYQRAISLGSIPHSDVFSVVVISPPSLRALRSHRCTQCPAPVSILRCSAASGMRGRCSPPLRRVLGRTRAPREVQ